MTTALILRVAAILGLLSACSPTVRVEAPDKPIEINLNIRIEQEVRLRVERDLEKAILSDPSLFGVPTAKKGGAQ